ALGGLGGRRAGGVVERAREAGVDGAGDDHGGGLAHGQGADRAGHLVGDHLAGGAVVEGGGDTGQGGGDHVGHRHVVGGGGPVVGHRDGVGERLAGGGRVAGVDLVDGQRALACDQGGL